MKRLLLSLLVLFSFSVACVQVTKTKVDKEEFKSISLKAKQGDAAAQCELGACYYEGNGVAKDDVEAVKWYRMAAEQGLADAQYDLGHCYAEGRGVAKDAAQAVKWYRMADDQ